MAVMDEALAILRTKFAGRNDLALASMVGYATALVDLKTAQMILSIVKDGK
jgi:hypothetical protein